MKKSYLVILAVLTVFILSGCRSGPSELRNDPNIPDWVARPPVSDNFLYGMGSANLNSTNQSLNAADSRARADLATKISTEVQQMIIDYSRTAGTEVNQTAVLSFYESVNRQLTQATLRGVELEKREKSKDGTYWSLVRISKADAAQISAEIIDSETSRYAEFKAMEALKMMEAQLNKK